MIKHCISIALYLFGTLITAFGIVLIIKANLGVSPWDVLHIAIADITVLTIGQAIQVLSILLTLFIILKRKHLRFLLMALPFIIVGNLVDLFNLIILSDIDPEGLMRILFFVIGIIIIPFGSALLIITPYPAGIYDELMLLLMHLFRTDKMARIRIIMEFTPMSLGLLITLIAMQSWGAFNVGTFVFIVLTGPMIKLYLALLRRQNHGHQQTDRSYLP